MTHPHEPRTDTIAPIAFEPIGSHHRARRRLPVAAIAIALVMAAILAILWFVFTARALTVQVVPMDAATSIKGGLAIPVADHYLLRPGRYQLLASAPGHHDLVQAITVGADAEQMIAVELEKLPGQLAVHTQPEGARIVLDGRDRGETPQTLAELPAGDYTIELLHPRHKPWRGEITLPGMSITEQLDVILEPAWGLIELTSEPTGAEIHIDGQPAGITPARIQVLERGETVMLKLPGHRRWEQTLYGVVGETLQHPTVTLSPAAALARIESTPAGATVTVNDRYQGRTPVELELEPGREHHIVLLLDGYHSAERRLQLEAGEERTVEIPLKPELGTLQLSASPQGATLLIDGKPQQPGEVHLPARPHRIEARLAGHVSDSRTVTPRPGMAQRVHFELQPEAAAGPAPLAAEITTVAGQRLLLMSPSGTFTLGSSRREQGRRANEIQRAVSFERPFYLSATPVTNAQFKQFRVTHSSSHFSRNTLDLPDQPVVKVSWEDAALYCNWLSTREGLPPFYKESGGRIVGHDPQSTGYRLASEAEWEWAARAADDGTLRRFPWGDSFPPPPSAAVNYADITAADLLGRIVSGYRDGYVVSSPVTAQPANAKGLYGMGHNVAEWVHDYYGIEATLGTAPDTDTLGPEKGEFRVIRGASWRHGTLTELRLSFRDYGLDPRDDVGFRIARYAR